MTRSVALVLLLAVVVHAAPVPKQSEKEKIEKQYGKIVDPKGDSKFALDGDKLVITLPANETRSFDYEKTGGESDPEKWTQSSTAPRVEQEVAGDFTATVRVKIAIDPKVKPIRKGYDSSFLAGGIQVSWSDSKFDYLGAFQQVGQKGVTKAYSMESPGAFSKGGGIQMSRKTEPPDEVWVKLERTGMQLVYSVGTDGKTFHRLWTNPKAVPEGRLTLALSAHHSSDKVHTVTFDEFKVEAVKPK